MLARRAQTVTPVARRSFAAAANPWGDEAWRHDKTAFLAFAKAAAEKPESAEKRQLYGFLANSFGDADGNKDGFITAQEFDHLCENVASLPRRFGLAPTWEKEYGGDLAKRVAARKALFDAIDSKKGKARGVMGMQMFVQWAYEHVIKKVAAVKHNPVDFYHIDQFTEKDFLSYLELAITDKSSDAHAALYEYVLTLFVEADVSSTGAITFDQFDRLISQAAGAPRFFGLAPEGSSEAARKAIFESMDDNKEGYVTFRKVLRWLHEHTAEKIAEFKAGKGHKKCPV